MLFGMACCARHDLQDELNKTRLVNMSSSLPASKVKRYFKGKLRSSFFSQDPHLKDKSFRFKLHKAYRKLKKG